MPIIDGRIGFIVNSQQVLLDGDGPALIYDRGQSEGPRSKTGEDKSERNRSYQCNFANTEPVIRAMIGYPKTMSANGGNFVRRYIPHSIPDWTINRRAPFAGQSNGTPYLYCTETDDWGMAPLYAEQEITDNVPRGEKVIVYDTTSINATYQTLPYDVLTDAQ